MGISEVSEQNGLVAGCVDVPQARRRTESTPHDEVLKVDARLDHLHAACVNVPLYHVLFFNIVFGNSRVHATTNHTMTLPKICNPCDASVVAFPRSPASS